MLQSLQLQQLKAMSTGDPQNEEIFLGPISNQTQYEKVQTLIQEGIDEGAHTSMWRCW